MREAKAWRKRRYPKAFISKLPDAESEAAETQIWLEFAVKFGRLDRDIAADLHRTYDEILTTVVGMIYHPETWILKRAQ